MISCIPKQEGDIDNELPQGGGATSNSKHRETWDRKEPGTKEAGPAAWLWLKSIIEEALST